MADNVTVKDKDGAAIVAAADDISSVFYPRVKLALGADGTAVDAIAGSGVVGTGVQRVTLATDVALPTGTNVIGKVSVDQTTPGTTNKVFLTDINAGDYETIAASQTDQALGATGAAGDYLGGLLIVPANVNPGAVQIKDGAGSAITVFTGGTNSVSNLVPFMVPLGIISGSGAWKITTGADVSAIGVGNFT